MPKNVAAARSIFFAYYLYMFVLRQLSRVNFLARTLGSAVTLVRAHCRNFEYTKSYHRKGSIPFHQRYCTSHPSPCEAKPFCLIYIPELQNFKPLSEFLWRSHAHWGCIFMHSCTWSARTISRRLVIGTKPAPDSFGRFALKRLNPSTILYPRICISSLTQYYTLTYSYPKPCSIEALLSYISSSSSSSLMLWSLSLLWFTAQIQFSEHINPKP